MTAVDVLTVLVLCMRVELVKREIRLIKLLSISVMSAYTSGKFQFLLMIMFESPIGTYLGRYKVSNHFTFS